VLTSLAEPQVRTRIEVRADAATSREALELELRVTVDDSIVRLPLLDCFEAYFEGASVANGTHGGARVTGRGWTEHQWDRA
jgi:hypothetical protein